MAEIQIITCYRDPKLGIQNVLDDQNPIVNYAKFWFNHNSAALYTFLYKILSISEKLIGTL